ncbi:thiamine/thiamine pyrophosphate ABC transporter permease ThiP [Necropsobacter massiliensis]|uniref:thiamine/thiamine pyrophosphate ABC transporter permease ThiP n=1 Tax=Necropsobacter massiliensis TaxID=1400001 RepID=UPI0009E377F1|nr:thiamine/thiamine pyrophosphate ABC transporter permease ThiP [Necropsobacter massiliensis]
MGSHVAGQFNRISTKYARCLSWRDGWGGIGVLLFLLLFYAFALQAVFSVGGQYAWQDMLHDNYLRRILTFSIGQALLSALLAVLIGALFARAFFYQRFPMKNAVLKLFSLTFVLPALVAVFGLIGVYGHSGWLATLGAALGLHRTPEIYGLSGILIAHLFFNIPLAARMFLQTLHSIPNQQRQLASQLNIRGWQFIRLIELPYLRQQLLPVFALVFMLCFTSFTIVLTLGGGPRYTTLEVAIYQAIVFEFDLPKAALFALLQFACCFVLFGALSMLSKTPDTQLHSKTLWLDKQSSAVKIWQIFCLSAVLLFILTPLLNTVYAAFSVTDFVTVWQQPQLWRALAYSVTIAPAAAFIALCLAMLLLLLSRRLYWRAQRYLADVILHCGMLILAIPTLVLAMGLFIRLQNINFGRVQLFAVVVICNALAAMPFVLRVLAVPMNNNMQYYEKLCQSLGIRGWQRWRLVEWYHLRRPIKYAFALAGALSLGDFTAIALFGSQDFTSLPHLLYQQLGHYHGQDAAATALLLLLLCSGIFMLVERDNNDD